MSDPLFDELMVEFTIVGIRQTCGDNFGSVMKGTHSNGLLLLIPEPENKYDYEAIALYNEDRVIGYILHDDIECIKPLLVLAVYTDVMW